MVSNGLGMALHISEIKELAEPDDSAPHEVLLPPLAENLEGCNLTSNHNKSPSPICPRLSRCTVISDQDVPQGDMSDTFCMTPPPESLDLDSMYNFGLPGSDIMFPTMTTLDEISLSQPPPLPSTMPMMKRTNSTKERLRSLSSGLRKLSFNSLQSSSQALTSAIHRDITPVDSPISPSLSLDFRPTSKLSSNGLLKMALPRPITRSSRSSLALGLCVSHQDIGLTSSVLGMGQSSSAATTPATDLPSFLTKLPRYDTAGIGNEPRNTIVQPNTATLATLPRQNSMAFDHVPEKSQIFFRQVFENSGSANELSELTIEELCGYADFLTKKRQSSLSSIESACAKLEASGWCTSLDIKSLELQRQEHMREIDEKLMLIELRLRDRGPEPTERDSESNISIVLGKRESTSSNDSQYRFAHGHLTSLQTLDCNCLDLVHA